MSLSISGGGLSADRVPVETTKDIGSALAGEFQPSMGIRDIKTVADLKKAELRGENYSISEEQLVKAIDRAIRAIQGKTTSLQFSVHQKTKMIAVKVLDADTGEVLREIPPEKTLDFVAKLWEMAGILVDERR